MLNRHFASTARGVGLGVVFLIGSALLDAAGAPVPVMAQAQPTGAASTVEFLALTPDGTPVRDLQAAEVSIRVGGRDRTVRGLELVVRAAPSTAGPALPAPFGTNAGAAGHTVLLAVEDESIPPGREREVREIADRIIAALGAGDRIGLVTLPRPAIRVAPTTDAAQVRDALATITGRRTRADNEENTCRTRDTLETLRGAIDALGPVDGTKTVLVFAGALNPPGRTAGVSVRRQTGESSVCEVTVGQYEGVGAAASSASARTYVVHVDDQVGGRNEGLEALAASTGGGSVLRATGGEDPVARIGKETAAYYVATLEPDASDRAGQPQRLDLRITRNDIAARAPTQYVARRGGGRGAGAMAPRDLLKSTDAFRGLSLRVVAYASRASGDKLRILVLAEPDGGATLNAAAIGLVDPTGKMQQVSIESEKLSTLPLMTALDAAPGRYRVRVAATDASGRQGAADYDLDASLTDAGALKLSGLVLGVQRGGAFTPAMQFSGEPAAVAYFEAYGQLAGNVAARVEIAKTIDGPALATVQPGGQRSSEPDKFFLTAEVPIASLEPGDYIVRAFLKVGDGAEGRLTRTLRKVR